MDITPNIRRVLINSKLDQISDVVGNFNNVINAQVLNSSYENEKIELSLKKESPYKLGLTGLLGGLLGGLILVFLAYNFITTSSHQKLWFWFFLFLPLGIFILYSRYIKKEGIVFHAEVKPMEKKDVYIMEIRGYEESGELKSLIQSDIDPLFHFMTNKSLNLAELPQETFLELVDRVGKEERAQKEAKEKARQEAIEQARRKVGLDQDPVGELSKVKSIDQRQKKLKCKCPNPDCGKTYFVKSHNLGRRAKCRNCGESFLVKSCEDNANH